MIEILRVFVGYGFAVGFVLDVGVVLGVFREGGIRREY